jgi:hypothetical protein
MVKVTLGTAPTKARFAAAETATRASAPRATGGIIRPRAAASLNPMNQHPAGMASDRAMLDYRQLVTEPQSSQPQRFGCRAAVIRTEPEVLETVSERLDPGHYAVLEPDALHQLVWTEIVRPHIDLHVINRTCYVAGLTDRSNGRNEVPRAMIDLGWSTALGGHFHLTDPLIDDFARAYHRLSSP